MKLFSLLTSIALLTIFTGCGEIAPLLSVPKTPKPSTDLIEVALKWEDNFNPEENVAVLEGHVIPRGSSVVLNVPSEIFAKNDDITTENGFATKAFFSIAEQQIERGLLSSGFTVLSRAKFEAKLRSMRSSVECSTYACMRNRATPGMQILMDDIAKKYKNGLISDDEYLQKVAYFKEKLNEAQVRSRRDAQSKELTDIAEVIRAASSAGVKADYILQINEFNSNKQGSVHKDINQIDEVRAYMRKYPEVRRVFKDGNNHIECAVTTAVLNAKLIEVATGKIVWIGENRANELNAGINNLIIELGSRTVTTNEKEIQSFVAKNNTEAAREARASADVSFPEWEYQTSFVPIEVISGSCLKTWKQDKDNSVKLARNLAKELIQTIKTVHVVKKERTPIVVAPVKKEVVVTKSKEPVITPEAQTTVKPVIVPETPKKEKKVVTPIVKKEDFIEVKKERVIQENIAKKAKPVNVEKKHAVVAKKKEEVKKLEPLEVKPIEKKEDNTTTSVLSTKKSSEGNSSK